MMLSEVRKILAGLDALRFRLPCGTYVPSHFHLTEVGLVTKDFIDCGGVVRRESVVNFQLWEAGDYDHRLSPQKFLHILDLSKNILGDRDLPVEVEYQGITIGKYGLAFEGTDFVLTATSTACLAQDACGISPDKLPKKPAPCCSSSGGCC